MSSTATFIVFIQFSDSFYTFRKTIENNENYDFFKLPTK